MLGIVILNWNGGDDTLVALRSLRNADLPPGTRIFVADNGSTDGSRECIGDAFPQATVIDNGANLGFAGGCNRGWQAAAGEGADRILFLNNDATVAPDAVRRLCAALDADPERGAVSPRIFAGRDARDGTQTVWFERGETRLSDLSIAVHIAADDSDRARETYETGLVCGCALMIRTEMLHALGGFDEAFFAYYEDADLSLRLRKAGHSLAVVPAAHVWHAVSRSTGGAFSPTSVFYCVRNARRLARKHADQGERRRFEARYLRAVIAQSRYFTHGGSSFGAEAGGAALQGWLCGLRNQTGVRPAGNPKRWTAAALLIARLP